VLTGALERRQRGYVFAIETDLAFGREIEAGNEPQEGLSCHSRMAPRRVKKFVLREW